MDMGMPWILLLLSILPACYCEYGGLCSRKQTTYMTQSVSLTSPQYPEWYSISECTCVITMTAPSLLRTQLLLETQEHGDTWCDPEVSLIYRESVSSACPSMSNNVSFQFDLARGDKVTVRLKNSDDLYFRSNLQMIVEGNGFLNITCGGAKMGYGLWSGVSAAKLGAQRGAIAAGAVLVAILLIGLVVVIIRLRRRKSKLAQDQRPSQPSSDHLDWKPTREVRATRSPVSTVMTHGSKRPSFTSPSERNSSDPKLRPSIKMGNNNMDNPYIHPVKPMRSTYENPAFTSSAPIPYYKNEEEINPERAIPQMGKRVSRSVTPEPHDNQRINPVAPWNEGLHTGHLDGQKIIINPSNVLPTPEPTNVLPWPKHPINLNRFAWPIKEYFRCSPFSSFRPGNAAPAPPYVTKTSKAPVFSLQDEDINIPEDCEGEEYYV